ncbi:hypothetical protein EDD18DRAFT_780288 [Armillaria luteobubalina]|uniref:F-box domain-containing protein n=1 Tax=Armillaria luteobubalina TaxID=153913 RepID=A0AA39QDA9_9AGAR|nr:hypothetical protein EDD18DRAFT_780288 [Armillaria luteobubalina]
MTDLLMTLPHLLPTLVLFERVCHGSISQLCHCSRTWTLLSNSRFKNKHFMAEFLDAMEYSSTRGRSGRAFPVSVRPFNSLGTFRYCQNEHNED